MEQSPQGQLYRDLMLPQLGSYSLQQRKQPSLNHKLRPTQISGSCCAGLRGSSSCQVTPSTAIRCTGVQALRVVAAGPRVTADSSSLKPWTSMA